MRNVKDFEWREGMSVSELVESMGNLGYQAIELSEAAEVILKMKRDGAKIFLLNFAN